MKKILWFVLLMAAFSMTGLLPFQSNDVASLVPVEVLTVTKENGLVKLNGGQCRGSGEDWDSALADLREGGNGTVFLGTAEQIIMSKTAVDLLPDVIRSQDLRPAAVICVCPDVPPEPEDAAKYLSAHNAGMTIQKVQAILLQGKGVALPILKQTEGGLRLYGSQNG